MIQEVRLPEISENVESGDVIKVLVSTGDIVAVDQPLLELETDKAVLEVPSPYKGKVVEVLVKMGDTVKVGQAVLRIDTADTKADAASKAPPTIENVETAPEGPTPSPHPAAVEPEAAAEPVTTPDHTPETPPRASPAVRRLARELGVDIAAIHGSGDGGRVLEEDVKKSARQALTAGEGTASARAAPAAGRGAASGAPGPRDVVGGTLQPSGTPATDAWGAVLREPMSRVRQVTARNLGRAWTAIPHVTHYDKADITALDGFQKRYAPRVEAAGAKLTVTAVLVKVAASALRVFPRFNASIDIETNEIVYKKYYHVGVAVDTDRGLLVPVIRDVDKKNITELSREIGALAGKARAKKIAPEELEGGTFTISNLGGIGGTGFSPIVYAPQVAILGVARARMEPVYTEGNFAPRLMLPLSVSYDHRIIDGADGARFLRWIVQALEEPFLMPLEG